jgi:hypothetical protein
METEFFNKGNYIYECKCSPSKIDGYFNTSYLKSSVLKLRNLWELGKTPSGYRYVFPINYIDSNAKEAIVSLQNDYPNIDIKYYECDKVQGLIISLNKIGDLPSLVDYLEKIIEQ